MTRHRQILSSLCAATLVAGFAACAQDGGDKTILITNNQAAPVDMCLLMPIETGPFRSSGTFDVLAPGGYLMLPQIKNLASSNGGTLTANRTFFAEGFRIALSSPNAETQAAIAAISNYSIPKGFTVPPDDSLFVSSLQLLPANVISAIAGTVTGNNRVSITAKVELVGKAGGDQVTSNSFDFPIEICRGCLVRDLGPCDMLDSTFMPTVKGNSCNPGQDEPVQCCTAGGGSVCPAIGTKL